VIVDEVAFPSRDGEQLRGRLYGSGDAALVLGHMGRPGDNQEDWHGPAEDIAAAGYTVLTYNRRGVCNRDGTSCSAGEEQSLNLAWQEVLGAVDFLHERGHAVVFAGGASIGAMAALKSVQEDGQGISGVVWFAGALTGPGYRFTQATVSEILCPKLLISASGDGIGERGVLSLAAWMSEPKTDLLVDGNEHGTDVFANAGPATGQIVAAIVEFLEENRGKGLTCG
jgi:alpha-beta hydrolase superfamily lysophospholipase